MSETEREVGWGEVMVDREEGDRKRKFENKHSQSEKCAALKSDLGTMQTGLYRLHMGSVLFIL